MRPTEDNYRHKGLRKKLVQLIHSKGITDDRVLDAVLAVPRHFFLDSAFDEAAYADRAFPIGEGQTISQPYTVAYQSQLLEVQPFMKVLEIGTGSAYQAVILAEMGAQVYTIERQRKLFDANKEFSFLKKYPTIKFFYGDGYEGLPTYAQFDRILITAAAPEVPPKLIEQIKPGGMMVLPLGSGDIQQMRRITKLENGSLKEEVFDNFSFVPMISGKKD
ncbi:MAG TPA: protein-L-isoaspartate(D-aspartate) O-methyltransferase [Chitinophagaceae bacterium]|nr:protein-L-isoaspartate(D-aspartate) O-methyltransferase [Chitinophagaceae bacterium]MCB9056042.1 protein-L-isoaspartate(D-aspartate) O-methyltransferase [Chitinophagales bacterium]HRX94533.1 protein-L-isoaspartate(D-aspartate) O-methyltransferase [Chitinophagaceae bacterium]